MVKRAHSTVHLHQKTGRIGFYREVISQAGVVVYGQARLLAKTHQPGPAVGKRQLTKKFFERGVPEFLVDRREIIFVDIIRQPPGKIFQRNFALRMGVDQDHVVVTEQLVYVFHHGPYFLDIAADIEFFQEFLFSHHCHPIGVLSIGVLSPA